MLLSTSIWIQAQNDISQSQPKNWYIHEVGLMSGKGWGINRQNLPEGDYRPVFGIVQISTTWKKLENKLSPLHRFCLVFEPQFNTITIKDWNRANENIKSEEFGLNIGLKHSYQIFSFLDIVLFISTGPHFINAETVRQSKHFIFSDNLGMGLKMKISSRLNIEAQYRLRHLSNAQLKLPNAGINTFNFMLSVHYRMHD